MANITIYQQNDQFFQAVVTDGLTAVPITDAQSVTATLHDKSGEGVHPVVELPMTLVAGSQGLYRGVIPSGFDAPAGAGYRLCITVVTATGLVANIYKAVTVSARAIF